MGKASIYLIISYVLLTVGLFIPFPIEFQNRLGLIIFEHVVFITVLILIYLNYKSGNKLRLPFKWASHLLNTCFLFVIGYLFVWRLMFDLTDYYPVWTDKKIYINQADTTDIIIGQEYYISGSIIDWRNIRAKQLLPSVRWITRVNTNEINGRWRLTNTENGEDTIANFKSGSIVVQ